MDKLQVSDVRTYFSSMVRYSCYRYLELKKRTVSIEAESTRKFLQDHIEVLSSAKGDDSEDVFRRVDFQELLMKCQSMLPELTYDIFETKRIEKMSYRQISKAFGISESRINFEMTKALKVFRKVFKDYGLFTVMLVCLFR